MRRHGRAACTTNQQIKLTFLFVVRNQIPDQIVDPRLAFIFTGVDCPLWTVPAIAEIVNLVRNRVENWIDSWNVASLHKRKREVFALQLLNCKEESRDYKQAQAHDCMCLFIAMRIISHKPQSFLVFLSVCLPTCS